MMPIMYRRTPSDAEVQDGLEGPHGIDGLLYGLIQAMAAPDAWIGCRLGRPLAAPLGRPRVWGSAFPIDRGGHGIHRLLTGDPLRGEGHRAFLLNGGRPIGDVDVGPSRTLLSAGVLTIRRTLDTFSPGESQAGWQAYPFWAHAIAPDRWDEPLARRFASLLIRFRGLRDYRGSAAEHDQAVRGERQ
jgi:hypothetical protein